MDVSEVVERVYRQHFGLFLSIGRRNYGLDCEMAKEMIQDAFTKVWKKRHTIRAKNEAGVRSFTITVFRRTCISHLRKPRLCIEHETSGRKKSDPLVETICDTSLSPLEQMLLIEEIRLQKAAVEQLPSKYRETVRLTLEGFKPREIAEILHGEKTQIRNWIYRGMKKYEEIINRLDSTREN
ncbi:MAG: hypothetical protein BA865_06015 [Desulfobacterales bacterium S5133MH4]|nr:MAG: hypothetical protein BA865_06015 [Desulfobacterales bacterium S5133MH4]